MNVAKYRTIMIVHMLAKIYQAVLEAHLGIYAEKERLDRQGSDMPSQLWFTSFTL